MFRFVNLYVAAALSAATLAASGQSANPTPKNGQGSPQSQQSSPAMTLNLSPEIPSHAQDCPASMSAQQRGGGGVLSTANNDPARSQSGQSGQRIRLILDENRVSQKEISSRPLRAKVTVHGTNGKWRVVNSSDSANATTQARDSQPGTVQNRPAQPASPSSPWIEKTLDLNLTPGESRAGESQSVHADLDLPGFTSVKSIRLDSVTYADGTTWTPNSGHACSVVPDPLMLVTSR